jgi:hypothetical protein
MVTGKTQTGINNLWTCYDKSFLFRNHAQVTKI